MIRVENLVKRYGETRAVDGISFEAREGRVYGLLGPNGAGKTTTMSIITGLLAPDEGSVLFQGLDTALDPLGFRAQLGVVPQEVALYEDLSARENLRFWGGLYGLSGKDLKRAMDRVLEQVGLTGRADERVKTFSGGMKRRLNLSLGLIHNPKAVLLDEPTVGIDPQARAKILEVVRAVAESGTTVLYTTHYLEEAEQLCDRIGILDHGKILAEGTLEELKELVGEEEVVTLRGSFDGGEAWKRVQGIAGVRQVAADEGRLILACPESGRRVMELMRAFTGLDVESLSIEPPSLNGLFLKLTGRELRD